MAKTIREINEKIRKGKAVILNAEEMIDFVEEKGTRKAANEIDVVTTGTFGPMCSSGMYVNFGHTNPRMKLGGGTCFLNDVPVCTGFAAVDVYLGCTQLPNDDLRNKVYPGEFRYGGGHVIQDFVAGEDIRLTGTGYGTDCYPKRKLETWVNIKDVNEAVLFNPRNAYQNYNVAINLSDKIIYTYMGVLKPNVGNANYCSAGQLSPLLNDPLYKTIGIGTRIFLGGGTGYVAWQGTQHNPSVERTEKGVPVVPSGTLAVIGDLKQMKPEWLVGTSMMGYGSTLTVGIGIPIPILNEEMANFTAVRDRDILAPIVDYSHDYPNCQVSKLGSISYEQLKSGNITIKGKQVPTASLSSYSKAKEIAEILKHWIKEEKFLITEPAFFLPGPESGSTCKSLKERSLENH